MSSNFLNFAGLFEGVDVHVYFTVAPPAPPPIPMPNGYIVGQIHPLGRAWRAVSSVRAEGSPVLQNGWAMIVVPHVALPLAPPHPVAQPANAIVLLIQSSSAPILSVHSVTAKGTALLAALIGAFGLNSDCGFQIQPIAVDLNTNSVVTSPTLGDYCAAVVGSLLNGLYNFGTAGIEQDAITIVVAVLQNLSDLADGVLGTPFDPIAIAIGKITRAIQQEVDK